MEVRAERRTASPSMALALALLAVALAGCASLRETGASHPVSVTWNDTSWCVPWKLKTVLNKVSQRYGPVTVHSTHRWMFENWRKGGASRSYHLACKAVDFSVRGDPAGVMEYLISRPEVGGYSRYPKGFYHIDVGPRRTW